MQYIRKDFYYKVAKEHKFFARSIFKIRELDCQFQLVRPYLNILDLGCYPGGWLQYVEKKMKDSGRILGVDIKPINASNFGTRVEFIRGDILKLDNIIKNKGPFDLILSDLSPKLTGVYSRDLSASLLLYKKVIHICMNNIVADGNLCMKVFDSENIEEIVNICKLLFCNVEKKKLNTSRSGSSESYLIAMKYKKIL